MYILSAGGVFNCSFNMPNFRSFNTI